jgi:hypothetical protein
MSKSARTKLADYEPAGAYIFKDKVRPLYSGLDARLRFPARGGIFLFELRRQVDAAIANDFGARATAPAPNHRSNEATCRSRPCGRDGRDRRSPEHIAERQV